MCPGMFCVISPREPVREFCVGYRCRTHQLLNTADEVIFLSQILVKASEKMITESSPCFFKKSYPIRFSPFIFTHDRYSLTLCCL